jgi:hypothetical protein
MTRNQTLTLFAAAILCASLTGCGTIPNYKDLGNGYVEATYIRTSSWAPTAMRIELRYKKGWGTEKIWPSLDGIRPILKDDIVVFVGLKAIEPPRSDEPEAVDSRLFTVRAPDLPLDITDEVLCQWSKESGEDFSIIKTASIVYPKVEGDLVEFHFATGTHKDLIIKLNWHQILDMMREVKEKGVVRKDPVWGTSYIEKEFKPETTDK